MSEAGVERGGLEGAAPEARRPSWTERLAGIPSHPGVYLLKDSAGRVIYVGKAKSLRSRVATYFRGGDGRSQMAFLVRRVGDVECLVTANEKEALILENNLIKQYRPRYNIRLKDDKSYVSVKITNHEWPRVLVTRKITKDGGRYFGPFHSASAIRETLDLIRKVFPLRTCSDGVFRNRTRPCLEHQIKRCLGPCVLEVDRDEYRRHLDSAAMLLEGRSPHLRVVLERAMHAAAEETRFEEAARLRDQIRALDVSSERQGVTVHGGGDADVFGMHREGGFLSVQALNVRAGRVVDHRAFEVEDWDLPDEEVLSSFLGQFYQGDREIPAHVLLPLQIEDARARADLLSDRRGGGVQILCPVRGVRRRLVDLARENARQAFALRRDERERSDAAAEDLARRLHLRAVPREIECIDISTLHGGQTVGSIVASSGGRADPSRYRRYRVRRVLGTDDFASVREVLERRLAKGREAGDLPDLFVIDGGRGQLGAAAAVFAEQGVEGPDLVALAKLRVRQDARSPDLERVEERVFVRGRANPVVLPRNSNALFLLQRVRDEAHRFAIGYHKLLRDRARLASPLDGVPGVGAARRRRLLARFGSLARLRKASEAEIAAVAGVGPGLARAIRAHLASADCAPAQ